MLTDDEIRFWLQNEEKPETQGSMKWALKYVVDPSYLQVMQLQLLRGRFFTEDDDEHAPQVAVIDDALAHRYFGSDDPVGKVLNFERYEQPVEIVGVVRHVNQWGLDIDGQRLLEQVYLPFMQMPDETMKLAALGSTAIVRTQSGAPGLFDAIHHSLTRINSGNTVYGTETMNQVIADTLEDRHFLMIMLEIFAGLALLLASIGIYGVISYVVGQRTHEFGVRMALGARAADILKLVLSGGGKLALIGISVGLFTAPFLTRLMKSLISGVGAIDPITYGLVTMLLMVVALAACWLPARRATKVDPMVALRYE
jgi:predicted permease